MTLPILRDDALTSTADGFELRLSLPWIRSLPVSSLHDIAVLLDGERADVRVSGDPGSWWFIQDRVVLTGERMLPPGPHDVSVSFSLLIPYLQAGPDGPLVLPFHGERELVDREAREADASTPPVTVSRDVA